MGDYTKKLKRIQTRGARIGFCSICRKEGPLSRDHVPPKGCNNLNDVEIRTLVPSEDFVKSATTSQGGTHYRTICGTCNNKRLGIDFDPELIKLSNEITSLSLGAKNKRILLPQSIHCFIKPQRIARAVVGHALAGLAINETKDDQLSDPISDLLRGYFLNENADFPEELEIYYWVYPCRRQVLIKGAGKSIGTFSGPRALVVGHIFKFLPLGFWLVFKGDERGLRNTNGAVKNLVKNKKMKLDEIEQVEIDLFNIPPLNFPEAPKGDEIILFNNERAVQTQEKPNAFKAPQGD